jgi:cysteine synthase
MNTKLSDNVGNTPLIPITIGKYTVWGKAEFMNPSGSVKDRMATYIINNAEKLKLIKRGSTLCEATSGNSGISFAMLAAKEGIIWSLLCHLICLKKGKICLICMVLN